MSSTSARCHRPLFDPRSAGRGSRRLPGRASGRDADSGEESVAFEYALIKRGKKRSAEETLWNALGLEGWELVGVTGKHAAFKRRLANAVSR